MQAGYTLAYLWVLKNAQGTQYRKKYITSCNHYCKLLVHCLCEIAFSTMIAFHKEAIYL